MEFGKKNKPKGQGCAPKGPGPRYKLKTLTGFEDHDPSKLRSPAYSMKFRYKSKVQCPGPGPYPIRHHLTHRGLDAPPAFTMAFRQNIKRLSLIPGPGAYAPEKYPPANHTRRAAAFTMTSRHDILRLKDGPGPIYKLPTCIGPDIPDLKAEGAYSMAFKQKFAMRAVGPGPAAYSVKLNPVKKQNPAYSMKFRHNLRYLKMTPGPQYSYNINLIKRAAPKYSMGVKYSECTTVGLTTPDDDY